MSLLDLFFGIVLCNIWTQVCRFASKSLSLIIAPHWSSRCTCILSYLGWLLTFVLSETVCPSSQISFLFFLSFQGFLYSFKKHLTPSIARYRFYSIFASFVQIFLLLWEIFYGVFIWMYPGFRISHCKGRRMWGWALEGKGVAWASMTEGECSRELKVIIWLWVWRWNSGRLSWEGIDCQIDGNLKIRGVLIIHRGFRKIDLVGCNQRLSQESRLEILL